MVSENVTCILSRSLKNAHAIDLALSHSVIHACAILLEEKDKWNRIPEWMCLAILNTSDLSWSIVCLLLNPRCLLKVKVLAPFISFPWQNLYNLGNFQSWFSYFFWRTRVLFPLIFHRYIKEQKNMFYEQRLLIEESIFLENSTPILL